jgi:hypothetical protein
MIDVDINLYCDECDSHIYEGDGLFCKKCFDKNIENSELFLENKEFRTLLVENGIPIPIKTNPIYLCPALPKILGMC